MNITINANLKNTHKIHKIQQTYHLYRYARSLGFIKSCLENEFSPLVAVLTDRFTKAQIHKKYRIRLNFKSNKRAP